MKILKKHFYYINRPNEKTEPVKYFEKIVADKRNEQQEQPYMVNYK